MTTHASFCSHQRYAELREPANLAEQADHAGILRCCDSRGFEANTLSPALALATEQLTTKTIYKKKLSKVHRCASRCPAKRNFPTCPDRRISDGPNVVDISTPSSRRRFAGRRRVLYVAITWKTKEQLYARFAGLAPCDHVALLRSAAGRSFVSPGEGFTPMPARAGSSPTFSSRKKACTDRLFKGARNVSRGHHGRSLWTEKTGGAFSRNCRQRARRLRRRGRIEARHLHALATCHWPIGWNAKAMVA